MVERCIEFGKQYKTKDEKIEFLRKLIVDYPLTYQRVLQGKNYKEVAAWIYDAVPKLKATCYNTATRLYWILNGLEDFPTCQCQDCTNKVGVGKNVKITKGYNPYCSRQCAARSDLTKQRLKETFIEKYGVDNPSKTDLVKQKILDTTLAHHGVKYYTQTQEYKEKAKAKLDQTNEKKYLTHKKNNSFHTSKQEDQIKAWILFAFPNTLLQYKSEKYPFRCDFYIPEKELYIEYLGSWTHGGHPFDKNDPNDVAKLKDMTEKGKTKQYYNSAIYTWTDLDVRKRNVAKENCLNYLEWWNMEEAREWIKSNSPKTVPFESLAIQKFKPSVMNPTKNKKKMEEKNNLRCVVTAATSQV